MRVLLLNDGGFGDAENVKFPVEVEALRRTDGGFFKIHKDELHRVGFVNFDTQHEWFFQEYKEAVLLEKYKQDTVSPPEQLGLGPKCGPTTCTDISHKCCNQFGERDEIQTIINSLQADVVARGNRIAELERALRTTNDELHGAINKINETLKREITSSDLDDPDYWDFQTVHDNSMLLGDGND